MVPVVVRAEHVHYHKRCTQCTPLGRRGSGMTPARNSVLYKRVQRVYNSGDCDTRILRKLFQLFALWGGGGDGQA